MRTPKEYTDNLKKKTITESMLLDCLYSVNKRAKIDQLQTEGHEITELVSTQFVKKVLALIDAGDFKLILSKPKK